MALSPNGSPALMRAINAARIVRKLREAGPMSRANLVRGTGLSKPTVTNVVAYLESLDYISLARESTPNEDGRTAQAPQYEYRASRGQVLGIDIGADKTLLVLADLAGRVLGSTRFPTRSTAPLGPPQIFEELGKAAAKLQAEVGTSNATLLLVVVGTPGVVSRDGIVSMAPQLEGWEGLNLVSSLDEVFPCPVVVESEVSLSLQAERWLGVARGVDDALFVHLGIGIGAGILVDGQIHRGADGGAGEIGLIPFPRQTDDGKLELVPLEFLAGGGALQERGASLANTPDGARLLAIAGGDSTAVDASTVFGAMRNGDPSATSLVREMASILAWGISCLVCALNPRAIVIGGGLSRSADLFLTQLQEEVATSVPFNPEWFVSKLGDEAVALGAVNQACAIVERDLFGPFTTKEL